MLTLQFHPMFVMSLEISPLNLTTLLLECYFRGDPQVSVYWTKDGVLISKSNTLVIRQATFKDKGYYECTAKNDYGEANSSFWIDVTGKPKLKFMSFIKLVT